MRLINGSVRDPFGIRREAGHPQPQDGIAMISRVLNLGIQVHYNDAAS